MMNIFVIVILNTCTMCSNVFLENINTFFAEEISEKNKKIKIKEYINNLQRVKDEDKKKIINNILSLIKSKENIDRFSKNISVTGNPYEIDKFEDCIFLTTQNIISTSIFSNEEDLPYIIEFLFLQDQPYPKNELNFWILVNPLLKIVIDNNTTKKKNFLYQPKKYDTWYIKYWTTFSLLNELRQNKNYYDNYKTMRMLKYIISYHITNKATSKEEEEDQDDKDNKRIIEDDNTSNLNKELFNFYHGYVNDLYFYSLNDMDANMYKWQIVGIFESIFIQIIFIERVISYLLFLIFNINSVFVLQNFCPHLIFVKWVFKIIYGTLPSQSLFFLDKVYYNNLFTIVIDMIIWFYIWIVLSLLIMLLFHVFFKFVDLCCLFNKKRMEKVKKNIYIFMDMFNTSKWGMNIVNFIYYGCNWLQSSFIAIWPISWGIKKIISSCKNYQLNHYNNIFLKEIYNMYLCKNIQNEYNKLDIIYAVLSEFEEQYIKDHSYVVTDFMKQLIKNIDNAYFKIIIEKQTKNNQLYAEIFFQIFSQNLKNYYSNIDDTNVSLDKSVNASDASHYRTIEENFNHLVKDKNLNVNDFILNILVEMMNFLRLEKKYLFSNKLFLSILIHRMYLALSDEDNKLKFFSIIKSEKDLQLQECILNSIICKKPNEIMEYVFGKINKTADTYLEAGDVESALSQSQHHQDKDIVIDEEYKEQQKKQEELIKHDNEIYNQCLQQINNLHHQVNSVSGLRNFIKSSIKIGIITSIIFFGFKFKHMIIYVFQKITVKKNK